MLEDIGLIHVPIHEMEGTPAEILRLIRVKFKIKIIKGSNSYHCWGIKSDTTDFDSFSGQYAVGEDEIGIYWTKVLAGHSPQKGRVTGAPLPGRHHQKG